MWYYVWDPCRLILITIISPDYHYSPAYPATLLLSLLGLMMVYNVSAIIKVVQNQIRGSILTKWRQKGEG